MEFEIAPDEPVSSGHQQGHDELRKSLTINVGSRKSQLALIQTNLVLRKLEQFYSNNPDLLPNFNKCQTNPTNLKFNIVSMETKGDKVLDRPLPAIGAKSLFTGELETALLEGRVDFVVHSLKDLPTIMRDGCAIGAIMKRDNPEDAIVMKKSLRSHNPFDLLFGRKNFTGNDKIQIGTSSQRRIAMIKRCNDKINCIDIRGNLNTRLSKLDNDEGPYWAIILARAGLDRMGWSERSSGILSCKNDRGLQHWHYAVGQGAIAVECRSDDQRVLELLSPIVDYKTIYESIAERSLMRKLEGGCSVPLGVRTTWSKKGKSEMMSLEGIVLSVDGKSIVTANGAVPVTEKSSSDAEGSMLSMTGIILPDKTLNPEVKRIMNLSSKLGQDVAKLMIDQGCLELMNRGT